MHEYNLLGTKRLKLIHFFQLAIIKILLEVLYVNYVYKFFEYAGFTYNFSIDSYMFGWLVFFVFSWLLYVKSNLYIFDLYVFLFIVWVIPNIICYAFLSHNIVYFLSICLPYILILLFTFNFKVFVIKNIAYGRIFTLFTALVLLFLVLLHYISTVGFRVNFNILEVYDIRESYAQNYGGGVFGYLSSWAFKVFSIFLLAWSVHVKHRVGIILSSLFIVLLFGFSGHKSALAGIFLIPLFYFMYRSRNSLSLMIGGMSSFLLLMIAMLAYESASLFLSVFVRRAFFVPAYLNYIYFDFFEVNQYYYWTNSSFNFISSNSVYNKPLAFVIGEYLGDVGLAANTGFVASGYANAGYLGIGFYTVIMIILMNFINLLAKNREMFMVMAILIMPVNSLFISSDLPTSLLTHGLLLSLLFLFLYGIKNYTLVFGKFKLKV